jgi:hypothetical protein
VHTRPHRWSVPRANYGQKVLPRISRELLHRKSLGIVPSPQPGTTRRKISLTISASSNTPYNIFSAAGSPSSQDYDVTLTVTNSAIQGSNTTGTAAIDTGAGWPGGSTITIVINAGATVCGMGGAGGVGSANPTSSCTGNAPGNGAAAGHALNLQFPVTLTNNGLIGGGGGGGGGGAGASSGTLHAGGGGGGGGAGGAGGAAGGHNGSGAPLNPGNGTAGTSTTNGVGGVGGDTIVGCNEANGGAGGDGGGLGASGSNGVTGTGGCTVGTGNGPGFAVKRNGNTLTGKADGTYSDANWKGQVG